MLLLLIDGNQNLKCGVGVTFKHSYIMKIGQLAK